MHAADLRLRVDPERDVRRDGHVEVPDPDARVDVGLPGAEPHGAEIDLEVPDPEAVLRFDVCRAARLVRSVADAVPETDVEGRGDDGRGRQDEYGDDGGGDRKRAS